jgi:hypothetical protein
MVELAEVARRKVRSPSFPFISLPIALDRARILYEAEQRRVVRPETAAAYWKYSAKSSGGKQTIGALRQFGLAEGDGGIKLTDRAARILIDGQKVSPERERLIKEAALLPPLHAKLWERYGPSLPETSVLRISLVLDEGFNDNSVEEFLAEYRETLEFAKLLTGPQAESRRESDEDESRATQPLPFPFPRPVPPPQADVTSGVGPATFPLLHGNSVEFRIGQQISADEVEDVRTVFNIWLKKIVKP